MQWGLDVYIGRFSKNNGTLKVIINLEEKNVFLSFYYNLQSCLYTATILLRWQM